MVTSVKELKARLGKFWADPRRDPDFRAWLAVVLMEVHQQNNAELVELAFAIRRAFSDAADGLLSPPELRGILHSLSQDSAAVNQIISVQASAFSQSVNSVVKEVAFPSSASSDTSLGVVFGSAQFLPT